MATISITSNSTTKITIILIIAENFTYTLTIFLNIDINAINIAINFEVDQLQLNIASRSFLIPIEMQYSCCLSGMQHTKNMNTTRTMEKKLTSTRSLYFLFRLIDYHLKDGGLGLDPTRLLSILVCASFCTATVCRGMVKIVIQFYQILESFRNYFEDILVGK